MHRLKKSCIFIVIFVIILFSLPSFTSAHAYIVKSTPFENQIMGKSPKQVSLQFDETIQNSFQSLRVFDMKGNQVDIGNNHIDAKNPSIIRCDLKPNLPNGTYRMEWKIVSSDGHPVEGVIPYGVGQENVNQTVLKSSSTGYFPHLDLIVIRSIQFISGAILIGLFFFNLFVVQKEMLSSYVKRNVKVIHYSLAFLWLSVLLNLPLQATIEANMTWKQVFSVYLLRNMVTNSLFGKVWTYQIILLVLLSVTTTMLVKKNRVQIIFWWTSLFLTCGFLMAKSFISHAFSADRPYLSITMDFLHLLGASIWVGSLMAMIMLLPLNKIEDCKTSYKEMIRSFFKWGVMMVLVLAFTGIYSSLLNVTTLDSLVTTNYGRVLFTKIVLFLIMLGFALFNFLKGKTNKDKQWGFSLKGEMAIGLIILVLAVILTNLPPSSSTPGPFKDTQNFHHNEQITLKIDPKVIGINHFEILLKDKSGKPLDSIQQVTLTFTPLERKLAIDTVTVPQVSVGRFYTQGMNINEAGRWKLNVHILTRTLDDYDIPFLFTVGNQ